MYKRSVWLVVPRAEILDYVPRCSKCGRYPKELLVHWFFSGLYCFRCVQGVLYDDRRSVGEVNES